MAEQINLLRLDRRHLLAALVACHLCQYFLPSRLNPMATLLQVSIERQDAFLNRFE
ncbi:hypothetical protein LZ012_11535 [Dechloromonas sp. XY25]|uniref:Uncharacterized protein n=1 Tax=Dechloromonas hankyongensis TaxID=2908002 RepID=A0ABS9K368_9RHOO|nr:hypothetical protein [Dechloromonas hankyongensis]MCG2577624.1 hypothetical protein [Dechloromonas hankyongensis]